MTPTPEPPTMRAPQQKKRRGCFFYGCLTSVVLALIVVVLGFFAVHSLKKLVRSYTDTAPMELPKVEVTDAEYDALQERLAAFKSALDKGQGTQELVLTEEDINALIARSPDTKELRNKIYVSIDDDQVKGQVSFPLDKTGFSWLKGRYLNGSATFNVSLDNGTLEVTANSVEVNGKPLPAQFMSELRKENLAKEIQNDPDKAKEIRKFESIKVQDGKVLIKARENAGAPEQ